MAFLRNTYSTIGVHVHKLILRSQQEARKRNISVHVASHSCIDFIPHFILQAVAPTPAQRRTREQWH